MESIRNNKRLEISLLGRSFVLFRIQFGLKIQQKFPKTIILFTEVIALHNQTPGVITEDDMATSSSARGKQLNPREFVVAAHQPAAQPVEHDESSC